MKDKIKEIILKVLIKWIQGIWDKIKEKPQNILPAIISIWMSYYLALEIFNLSGILTIVGYVFAVIYGIAKIIDDPYRIIYWAMGYIIGQQAVKVLTEMFIPRITANTTTSLVSAGVILYVVVALYLKAMELKKS
ncbi:hypothetical protein GOV04_04485 [Candidatus Woesearchaeota archaeon]|nr:hypothetical protein [Candidatus Woesearchaeota archaeon]